MESGSLGDAARRLKIRQPNLTKSIQALERSLGSPLFIRSPHGMKPTALARALEARARVISGEIGRAQREVGEFIDAQRGKVVIGTGPLFTHAIFRRALARFRQAHPRVDVAIVHRQAREIFPAVKTGDVDFTLHIAPQWLLDDEFASEIVMRGCFGSIAANARHPLAGKRRVTLKDLSTARWMLPTAHDNMRSKIESIFEAAGLPPIKPVIECDSVLLLKDFLRDETLVGIFIDAVIEDELLKKRVKFLRVPELAWKVDLSAIYRRDVPLPPAARALLAEIRKAGAEHRSRR